MNVLINFKIKNNAEEIIKTNIKAKYKKYKQLEFSYDNESINIEINNNNIIMHKENNESVIVFNFKLNQTTESKYYIKELDFYIDTVINTKKLKIEKNKIDIEYNLKLSGEEIGNFKYQIIIKEM